MKIDKFIITGGSALLLPLIIIIVPWYPGQLILGLVLIAFLPGYALLDALWPRADGLLLTGIERWLMAVAVSYGLTITLLMLMVFARVPLNAFSVAGGLGGITLVFALFARWQHPKTDNLILTPHPKPHIPPNLLSPISNPSTVLRTGLQSPILRLRSGQVSNLRSQTFWLILVLFIAGFFRMANVHYSDHQGDEADILLRAVSLVYGDIEAILTHSKGPGEIFLLNAVGAVTGRFDEQTARLPFSLAGTVSIGLIALLGTRLFNELTGIVAGLLGAVDGVFVSYARTAQYQSVVLLLTLAAIWCFYCFHQRTRPDPPQSIGQSRRLHAVGTFLLAASCLVHFETILLLPVALYLTLTHLSWSRPKLVSLASPITGHALGITGLRRNIDVSRAVKRVGERDFGGTPFRLRSGQAPESSAVRLSLRPELRPRGSRRSLRPLMQYASHFKELWPSALVFVTTVIIFYVPFLLHPNVKNTGIYLENRIGGGSFPPFNNLGHFFYFEALKYNSAYYVVLFNALLLVAAVIALASTRRGRGAGGQGSRGAEEQGSGIVTHHASRITHHASPLTLHATRNTQYPIRLTLPVITLFLAGTGLAFGGFHKLSALAIGLGVAGFLALVIFSPQTPLPQKTLWIWVAPSFLTYVFLVNRPGKHHYLFLAALVILVGFTVTQLWQWATAHWSGLRRPVGQGLIVSLVVILLLLFAAHTVMVFLRSDLEYVLTYPEHKSAFYPTDADYPYGTRIGFGYPFRLGWQVIGQLKRTGQLDGTWAGNDDGNAPNWYMLNTPSTPCYPDYVLRGEITYKGDKDFDVPFVPTDFGYVPRYRIWGNGRLRMTVLEFNPAAEAARPVDLYETSHFSPPVTAADFAASFVPLPTPHPQILLEPPPILGEGSEIKNNAPPEYLERAQHLAGRVSLAGYDLDSRYAYPGGIVPITLYWQTQSVLGLRYKVFVHLVPLAGQSGVVAQADGFPACGTSHANTWPPGATVLDRHLLQLPPDISPGDYTLLVGMYEPKLNLRLNYFDIANNEQGNSLTVGTLTVR